MSPVGLARELDRTPEVIEFPRAPDTMESLLRERQCRQYRREEPLDHCPPIDGLNYCSFNFTEDQWRLVWRAFLHLPRGIDAKSPEEQLAWICDTWFKHCPRRLQAKRKYPDYTKHLPEIWR